jgi:hypothetical protein
MFSLMAQRGNTLNTLHEKLAVVHQPGARGFGAIRSGGETYPPVRKSSSRKISSVVRFTLASPGNRFYSTGAFCGFSCASWAARCSRSSRWRRSCGGRA